MIKDIFGIFKYLFYIAVWFYVPFIVAFFFFILAIFPEPIMTIWLAFCTFMILPVLLILFLIFPAIITLKAKKEKWSKYLNIFTDSLFNSGLVWIFFCLISYYILISSDDEDKVLQAVILIAPSSLVYFSLIADNFYTKIKKQTQRLNRQIKKPLIKKDVYGLTKYLLCLLAGHLIIASVSIYYFIFLDLPNLLDEFYLDISVISILISFISFVIFYLIFPVYLTLKAKKENWSEYLNFFFNKPIYLTLLYISSLISIFTPVRELFLPFFVPMATVIYLTVIISGIVDYIRKKQIKLSK